MSLSTLRQRLIEHLETVEIDNVTDQTKPFRLPVQWVNRPNLDFRGFSGLISGGTVKPGDAVEGGAVLIIIE